MKKAIALLTGIMILAITVTACGLPAMAEGIKGDASGDGQVTVEDLTALCRVILGTGTVNSACDLTGDGKVNLKDLLRLKKILADSDPSGTVPEDWEYGD